MGKPKKYSCLLALALILAAFHSNLLCAQDLEIHFINLGHGDCSFVKTPDGRHILIDAGFAVMGWKLKKYLKSHHVESIDLMVLTHPHPDHYGGMKGVIKKFKVKEFVEPGIPSSSKAMASLLDSVARQNIRHTLARRGKNFNLGEVALDVLSPPEKLLDNVRSPENGNSIVMRLCYGDIKLLFTGDIEGETEKFLLESGEDLASHILKVPHHGISTSSTPDFLDTVRPCWAVIQCAYYAEPSRELYDHFQMREIKWFRNDANGTVVFRFKNGRRDSLIVECERGKENTRLKIAPDWFKLLGQVKALPQRAKHSMKTKVLKKAKRLFEKAVKGSHMNPLRRSFIRARKPSLSKSPDNCCSPDQAERGFPPRAGTGPWVPRGWGTSV